jgi:23S rRNA (pseudouridine1915-N3)-methyltransferase
VKISILQIGKTKDSWLNEGIEEYLKRLSAFVQVDVIELADASIKMLGNPESVRDKEAMSVMKRLDDNDYVVLLDELGAQKTSVEFAEFLVSLSTKKHVVFVIGGVFGASKALKERADCTIALSRMTFTHRMARLILCEQIYRAMMINANRSYHV